MHVKLGKLTAKPAFDSDSRFSSPSAETQLPHIIFPSKYTLLVALQAVLYE